MRTRSQARRRRQPQVRQTSVESSNLEKPDNPPIVTMADNRTMAQLLEAPTEGYEDAIVIPEITANNFEIKHGLLNLVQNKQFFGLLWGPSILDTIPWKELGKEVIKSSVEILVPTPSDSEDFSDLESECDMSDCDNFTTFSNPLFDDNDSNTSNDEEEFKISSNPLYDLDEVSPINEEVLEKTNSIPPGIEISCFNSESDLLESLLNRDSSNDSSQKIDSLLDEFAGELTSLQSIPPGIDNINFDSEGDILFLETFMYDKLSSPTTESCSNSIMMNQLFTGSEDSIPPGILENDDFVSEDDE
ncbi:hypothetical protein Tco_0657529 [Tanacetum coccineum]|uniref:Reverse transcriptase domain-containing protein n=1 Tax=Tanacetum coccineum TaxID=301880 RepID=A0ABQ4XBU0_9ASTR